MPCYSPYTAYRSRTGKNAKTGKHPIVFKKSLGIPSQEIKIACGQCYGCRLESSRIWALRCLHESKIHDYNEYITLTYDEESLQKLKYPDSTEMEHLKKFWKKLRKKNNIRYYACSEYGEETGRPHYHAIVFGLKLDDKKYYKTVDNYKLYNSAYLNRTWGHGNVIIGNVTFESCAYVARYVMKKWKSRTQYELDKHYERINKETGEVYQIEPEKQYMSRRPGIGTGYYKKFKEDFYQAGTDGRISIRGGIKTKPPSFYDSKYELESNTKFRIIESIKQQRRFEAEQDSANNTPSRLRTRESIARNIATKRLPRPNN